MRKIAFGLALLLVCGCGGGGAAGGLGAAATAQELLQDCVQGDLQDLAALLNLLQNLVDQEQGAPVPEFDLVAGILGGGILPFTLDVDGDGRDDLTGNIWFTDAAGNVTIPFDVTGILTGGPIPSNPLDLVQNIPDGTTLQVEFDLDGLLLDSGNTSTGDGTLSFDFENGLPSSTSGSGTLETDLCTFGFDFDGIGIADLQAGGLAQASVGFDLVSGSDRLVGSIELDGTGTAQVTARLNGGPAEVFTLDLTSSLPG